MSTLIEGSIINSFKNTFGDIKKSMYSFYLMDLCLQVLKENNNKEIFNLLSNALIKIDFGLSPELISNIVEIKLLDYLGVSLNLEECSLCGNKEDLITIDITSGGVICKNCYNDGYIMNNKALHLMSLLKKVDISKLETLEITDDLIFKEIDKFIYEYYYSINQERQCIFIYLQIICSYIQIVCSI